MTRRVAGWAGIGVLVAGLAGIGVLLVGAAPADAHPLGNLSVNSYDGVTVRPAEAWVDHVEDLAELPALAAVQSADRDGDGRLAGQEARTWANGRCAAAADRIGLRRDGVPTRLRVLGAEAVQRTGSAGLPLLRVDCRLTDARALPVDRPVRIDVQVRPVAEIGWREITFSGDGAAVRGSDVPAVSVSARLTAYPDGAADRSPDGVAAHALVIREGTAPGGSAWKGGPGTAGDDAAGEDVAGEDVAGEDVAGTALGPVDGPLTGPVDGPLTGLPLLGLLLVALVIGATHALAPGHGKTVLAAAMIAADGQADGQGDGQAGGRRAPWSRAREAVLIGAAVTGSHTLSVLAVAGAVTVLATTLPAGLTGWFEAASGVLVVLVGIGLLRAAIRRRPGPAHGHGHGHGRRPPRRLAGLVGIGLAGGLTPSPSALLLLLGANAAGRPWAGLAAVLAFGAGMATTLTLVGVLVAAAGDRLLRGTARRPSPARVARPLARVRSAAPRLASSAVVVAGGLLTLRGIAAATGW